ncbi:F0F1 ATP synthase subunit A [Patescibacteria group bacterium]|nr:F0F1 ATP synthase subunit A [Patescibacteria group bacterium]
MGLIELVGEVAKILSLSLRLFGNILAGMVLM